MHALPAWLAPLIAAPFVGSFLGVLIRRLPVGQAVAWSRSACESCGTALGPAELVPVLSFLLQRGRCQHCAAPIAPMHLGVELAATAIAAWAALLVPDAPALWLSCLLGWTLLALAWIDARTMLLPDALTLPLVLAGLAATWALAPESLSEHAVAAAGGYLALRGLGAAYRRLRGREGLGQGDAKLLAAAGAWVGLDGLAPVLLTAALAGLALALLQHLRGRTMTGGTALPFGPPLALAIWLVWLYGSWADSWLYGAV